MLLGETRATGQDRHRRILYPPGYICGCEPAERSDISMSWAAEPSLGPIVSTATVFVGGIIPTMTDAPESKAESVTMTGKHSHDQRYDATGRLGQVLAWVGIIAGVVFVTAVIFFSGILFGWSASGHFGSDPDGRPDGSGAVIGTCPMTGQRGMMKPGDMGPGGRMGPGPSPVTTGPSTLQP